VHARSSATSAGLAGLRDFGEARRATPVRERQVLEGFGDRPLPFGPQIQRIDRERARGAIDRVERELQVGVHGRIIRQAVLTCL
jgi:hypothetical protein